MNPALDDLLCRLEAAKSDPAQTALAVADFACAKSPALARALAAAAIPHWFTQDILAALLDDDLRPQAADLHQDLLALPMIENYPERAAHAVHDQTRLALRERLWNQEPERFKRLSQRAADCFGHGQPSDTDFVLTAEHVFHELAGQSDLSHKALWTAFDGWKYSGRWEALQSLARMLEELCAMKSKPPLLPRVHGWALIDIVNIRQSHQTKQEMWQLAEQAHGIFKTLAVSDSANAEWQRDLCVSFNMLGDLAVAQGVLPIAVRYFTEAKAIAERLAASDPANAELQRDLSVLLGNLGDLAMAQGDLPSAAHFFAEEKTIAERLATSDPANTQWQRDLFISLSKISDVAVAQGDISKARHNYGLAFTVNSHLAASDPANAEWQRDLTVSLIKLGELAAAQDDLEEALSFFTKAKAIAERLAASDSTNAEWQRDLTVSFIKLGELAVAQGDLLAALHYFTESKANRERLAASDPANAEWQRDLWVAYWRLADLCEKDGKAAEAIGWWKKAHDTLAGMKQRGLHISPQDEGFLERLRAKTGR